MYEVLLPFVILINLCKRYPDNDSSTVYIENADIDVALLVGLIFALFV